MGPQAKHAPPQQVVRLYVDTNGDLYPDLANQFLDAKAADANRSLVASVRNRQEPDWQQYQADLWTKKAQQIVRVLGRDKTRPVVFLIHGFRVADGESDADATKRRILESGVLKSPPLFVHVNWDAGAGSPVRNEGAVQLDAPIASLRLRQLLSAFEPTRSVRIVTNGAGTL